MRMDLFCCELGDFTQYSLAVFTMSPSHFGEKKCWDIWIIYLPLFVLLETVWFCRICRDRFYCNGFYMETARDWGRKVFLKSSWCLRCGAKQGWEVRLGDLDRKCSVDETSVKSCTAQTETFMFERNINF
jgi:hypothetical protein